jgi:hypothetical protein
MFGAKKLFKFFGVKPVLSLIYFIYAESKKTNLTPFFLGYLEPINTIKPVSGLENHFLNFKNFKTLHAGHKIGPKDSGKPNPSSLGWLETNCRL